MSVFMLVVDFNVKIYKNQPKHVCNNKLEFEHNKEEKCLENIESGSM